MRIFTICFFRGLLRSIRIISTVSVGKYRQEKDKTSHSSSTQNQDNEQLVNAIGVNARNQESNFYQESELVPKP